MLPLPMTPAECLAGVLPAARSANGTPLFDACCPDCGKRRLADRRRVDRPCLSCSNKRRATHGLSRHPLFLRLQQMRGRCELPSASGFSYYGGRGIRVCAEWRENPAAFVAWAEANGYRSGLEIDRIDNDGDYCPENCRFVSHVENSRKRRNRKCSVEQAETVRALVADGETIRAASRLAGTTPMAGWHAARSGTWA